MRKMKATEPIIDFGIYPRMETDTNHIRYLQIAHEGGAKLPPIVVDKKSLRIVDGIHRTKMYRRIDKNMEIEVIEKDYKSDVEMFADAIRLNAHHGRNLSPFDRTHCILRAEELGLTVEETAAALSMTVEAVGELKTDRVGKLKVAGKKPQEIPIKRTISHMAGKHLTSRQVEANERLGGMNQGFYVNQLIELIESNLIDTANEQLCERLKVLSELLDDFVAKLAA